MPFYDLPHLAGILWRRSHSRRVIVVARRQPAKEAFRPEEPTGMRAVRRAYPIRDGRPREHIKTRGLLRVVKTLADFHTQCRWMSHSGGRTMT